MAMRVILLVIVSMTLSAAFVRAQRPNVVVLLSDDLGYRDIGCYGGPVKTPTLDGLAKRGTRFTDFYAACSVCSPTRATLLTGRHHIRTGVWSWIHPTQRMHLLEREITLAEHLKKAGYATAHFGKWHLGMEGDPHEKPTPDRHGFDYWFATENNAEPSHRSPVNFVRNGKSVGKIQGYSCQIVVNEAIGWLDQHWDEDKPFFLNVWFHEPHAPIAAPEKLVRRYGKLKSKPAIYSGTIDNTDRAIARLLAKLDALGVTEDTLIIYASDNGSYLEERTGRLRGAKGTNWEGGLRVPGIFVWPGRIAADRVAKEPAGVVDMLPTICALIGIDPPDGVHLDGSDISPLLAEKAAAFARHQPLYWHLYKSRPMVVLRDGDWSLVADPDYELSRNNRFDETWIPKIRRGGYTNYRLYNLRDDPGQTTDLAAKLGDRVERMKRDLLRINASVMSDGHDWSAVK